MTWQKDAGQWPPLRLSGAGLLRVTVLMTTVVSQG
jgi:hypothetical protein